MIRSGLADDTYRALVMTFQGTPRCLAWRSPVGLPEQLYLFQDRNTMSAGHSPHLAHSGANAALFRPLIWT